MNKTYALVWNQAQGCWNAVGETARRHGKSAGGKRLAAAAVSLLGLAALPAFALPTGEAITAGKADIVRDADGKSMSINQHSDKLVTNWQSFDVAGGERVAFRQPGSQSIALNRVIGNNGSQIHGSIDANGKVFLVNPNGMVFGSGAQVNVGGLVASTQAISDADFLAGNYRFAGNSAASIVNDGKITAADGGSVALLGARVSNNGVIQAKMGRVALGAGNAFKVNFDGNDLLSLQVEGGAVDAQATNGGLLKADGGEVLMTARAAGNLLNAVVNNSGTIEAKGLASRGGKITLDGDTVNVGGTLDASGAQTGSVVTRGQRVNVAADTNVDTRAGNTAGTWSIEAANAGVNGTNGGDRSIAADTLSRNLGTTNVALTNTQGDLSVDGPLTWNSDNALTLTAQKGSVDLRQALSATGTNASVAANAADKIRINDAIKLTGRNAHLELNAKNGHDLTNDKAVVTLSGSNASFSSNGEGYKVLHTVADLRNVDANLNGRYVVGNAIDGANASFRGIGGDMPFFGKFDGLGNTISRLNVSNPGQYAVGLFTANHGSISNLNLSNVTATAAIRPYGSPVSVGALAGYNFGTISNVTAKDVAVTGKAGTIVGGLVGGNYGGTIEHASVSGRVEGERDALAVGGLVGENFSRKDVVNGKLTDWITATIRDSHADVNVKVAGAATTGGLVGRNTGTIDGSSSTGAVTATGDSAMIGGLVGMNFEEGVIKNASSSATATVAAGQNAVAGGIAGMNFGAISASHANGKVAVSSSSTAGGLAGINFGNIGSSTANGDVTINGSGTVGGLVGANHGHLGASKATGNVTAGNGSWAVGGLAGTNSGDIDESVASGNVAVGNVGTAGGLVGRNDKAGRIHASNALGQVKGGFQSTVGGFAGQNNGIVDTSKASGTVLGGASGNTGGFVGANASGRISTSDATGDVIASDNGNTGGFAGFNVATIDTSSAAGNVTGRYAGTVGGFTGLNIGTLKSVKAGGNASAGYSADVGGLVGRNFQGTVSDGHASGSVKALDNASAGGLIGHSEGGSVSQSTASGNVEAGANANVGGLVGRLAGTIEKSSATGSVKGGDDSFVGGLVGYGGGVIRNSSSSGTVSGGRYAFLGGLVGANFGTVYGSSTTSRVDPKNGYSQTRGSLVGLNIGAVRP
ncbi:TPA: filamentous hemagglutinin N-terminal domain-containing protein [Burkholderia cenocepacia]|uniref:two-partner secretion domain-containing protein n=1 Tax=unclassified Burkholderia TaxID=2613784 RepID=UPI00158B6CED|nr:MULTISPECIES: GLUG motif-containing protein [unclassified Burkholderia]HEF5873625.1 filamentous hemagglutinin N-terminal domain-containing protein [Burkholderia cenocepacia]